MEPKLKKLLHPHQVSFEDYLWARIQVTSRAMEFPPDGSLIVVPIIDFANHSYRDQNAFWDLTNDGKQMGLFLLNECPVDSEIFISYEQKDQFQMICIYGFCAKDNPSEYLQFPPNMEVFINQSLSPEMKPLQVEELMRKKCELLEQLRGPESYLIHRPAKKELDLTNPNPTNNAFSDTYMAILFLCLLKSIPSEISFKTHNSEIIKDFLIYCQSRDDFEILSMFIFNIMFEELSDYISILSKSKRPESSSKEQLSRLDNIDILRKFNKTILEEILQLLQDLVKEFSSRPAVLQYLKENGA